MTTHITRSGNNRSQRMVRAEEANDTGKAEAQQLLANIALPDDEDSTAAAALHVYLVKFIALVLENRIEEWSNRLRGFCDVIGPVLQRTQALEAKCALLSASLNQADRVAKITSDEQRGIEGDAISAEKIADIPHLSAINPLIEGSEWNEDTASNVRGALGFIADAIAGMGPGKISDETTYGASRLILCCVAAMDVAKV